MITTHAASFGRPLPGADEAKFMARHGTLSMGLFIGTGSFLAALGVTGWIHSRALGVVSSVITLFAARVLFRVASPYFELEFSVRISPSAGVLLALLVAGAAALVYRLRRWRRTPPADSVDDALAARVPSVPERSPERSGQRSVL